jgi:hypothetical protein
MEIAFPALITVIMAAWKCVRVLAEDGIAAYTAGQ